MSVRDWFARFFQAVNREYDRRIKAASEVTQYGLHHASGHADVAGVATGTHPRSFVDSSHAEIEDEAEEIAEIVNVRPGTRLNRASDAHTGEER